MRVFFAVVVAGLLLILLAGALYFQPVQRVAPKGCGAGLCTAEMAPGLRVAGNDPGGVGGGGG